MQDPGRFGVTANRGTACARGGWLSRIARRLRAGRDAPLALAAFPLSTALTAPNLARHPRHGALLADLLERGVLDGRTAVMAHLIVERLQQRRSGLTPWFDLLPTTFETTLFYEDAELAWLRGTTLHRATL